MTYNPIQPHHLFSEDYSEKIKCTETVIPELSDVLICMWESFSVDLTGSVADVIVPDGCIDLIVNVLDKSIFYSGISMLTDEQTNFNFITTFPEHYFGFRLKPGAFLALTGMQATVAMDRPTPLEEIDPHFDKARFFEMEISQMKQFTIDYLAQLAKNVRKSDYIQLFEHLYLKKFATTEQLYAHMELSPRQVQRQFKKHYGLTPQMVISVIKFQHCLKILLDQPSDRAHLVENYYDQSHFINEFKKNIGLTPVEFIKLCQLRKASFLSNTKPI